MKKPQTKNLNTGGLWVKMQINYIERRFGRKLTQEEKELLTEELKKKFT